MIDVYVKTIKSDGIQGLYRGFVISCVGIFIYRGMYFGLYDSIKPILLGENASVFLSFLLGWVVTVTAGLMSYPIDTIRRRMMRSWPLALAWPAISESEGRMCAQDKWSGATLRRPPTEPARAPLCRSPGREV